MIPLVLLHGFPFDSRLWAPVSARLPAGQPVYAPDLPGFGAEPPLPTPTMNALADWLAAWLEARGVERAIVVGHSMGGYVALAFAARHPVRVAGLGLIHSTAAPDAPEKRAVRAEQLAHVAQYGPARLVPTLIRPLVAPANAARLASELDEWVTAAAALPAPTVAAVIGALRDRPDRRDVLATASFSVLFVAGGHDPVVPVATARAQLETVSKPFGLALVELPAAGHLGMLEDPEAIATALEQLARAAALPLGGTTY